MMDKPNVIVITTDQQRYDSLGLHGSSFMHTPAMDRIGNEGVSFSRAYCPNTVCTPSRVSIMTGLHLSRHGAYNIGTSSVIDSSYFLSSILGENGYRTHHIGKAHWYPWAADNPETAAIDQEGSPYTDFAGFQTAEVCRGHGTWGLTGHYAHWLQEKGYSPEQFAVEQLFTDDPNETGDWNLPVSAHSNSWLAERAIHFLKNHTKNQPFYLNLGFQDPHHPHILPQDFEDRVDPADIPLPECHLDEEKNLAEHIPFFHQGGIGTSRFNGKFQMAGNGNSAWKPYFQDERKARATRAYYYSMVQLIDKRLGEILDTLDEQGLRENTIVVFTTDHGEMLGDHGIGQKGPLIYEGVTHIPFLMRYPAGFEPGNIDDCVSLTDVVPTILDFVQIEDSAARDGISLKNYLQGGMAPERKGVRIEYKEEPDRIRYKCWVTKDWKLAVYLGESFGELYDLTNDPGERNNLFHCPEHHETKTSLLIEMLNDMESSEPISHRPCRC